MQVAIWNTTRHSVVRLKSLKNLSCSYVSLHSPQNYCLNNNAIKELSVCIVLCPIAIAYMLYSPVHGRLASFLIYARALLENVMFIMWLRSVMKMLPSVKFAEDDVLTFLILREKC